MALLAPIKAGAKAGLLSPGIKAYHGSPHDFDQFSSQHIGTGEGAQAYGRGLYFTETEDVAKAYRKATDNLGVIFRDEAAYDYLINAGYGHTSSTGIFGTLLADADGDIRKAINKAEKSIAGQDPWLSSTLMWLARTTGRIFLDDSEIIELKNIINDLGARVDSGVIPEKIDLPKGSMYEVNIDASPDELLDWDKPLSEQSERVQDFIKANKKPRPTWRDYRVTEADKNDFDGDRYPNINPGQWIVKADDGSWGGVGLTTRKEAQELALIRNEIPEATDPKGYVFLEQHIGKGKEGADKMRAAGIKGIKYADAFTRHKSPDKRSYNYVVFDDKIIDIAKKYGISLTMASAVAAGTMTPQEAQAGFLPATTKGILGASSISPKATHKNLLAARTMLDQGVEPRTVYGQTGYFRAADGKLRFEAPDPESIDFDAAKGYQTLHPTDDGWAVRNDMSKAIDQHPAKDLMFGGSYPSIRTEGMETFRGYYDPSSDSVAINNSLRASDQASTLAHELQHAVQDRNDFALGANPNSVKQEIDLGLLNAQRPLFNAAHAYDSAIDNVRDLSRIAAATKYRKYSLDSNLTGKRRLLVGNGDWYEHGDKIRQELGPEPKRHRPKAERERWLGAAWAELAQWVEPLDDFAYAKLYDISKTPRGAVGDYIAEGKMYLYNKDNSFPLGIAERAELARERLLSDPKLADKQIKRLGSYVDSIRDDAAEYSRLKRLRFGLAAESDYELYRRSAGEVEARNVQNRLGMTQDDRYASYPLDTEDIPRHEQILNQRPSQEAQRGAADPRALAATGLLGAAAAPTLATPESKGKDPLRVPAGLLDAAANMGAAMVAPYANMPHTLIQALTSDRPTKDIKKARDARAAAMDYQPRTKLGKTISDEGLRYLAEAIAPAMAAGVAITEPIQEFYGLLPPRVRLVGETLLDAF